MPNPFIDLATSKNFRISHEYETVWLFRDSHSRVVIGDFYGDPIVAIIDAEERWCAVGGCGLIVYLLDAPFKPYEYDQCSSQYLEAGRTKQDQWWVESIEQTGPFSICVKCDNGIQHNLQLHRVPDSDAELAG
ncbi:hypothetical protein [Duganella sp. S19_KUP01_CR8]|uniref:hypothetical protein n=1 Tax=Duganella sp. S19_KUP01_CR8 TaxID=3025502 RepID=UPI002FCDC196